MERTYLGILYVGHFTKFGKVSVYVAFVEQPESVSYLTESVICISTLDNSMCILELLLIHVHMCMIDG